MVIIMIMRHRDPCGLYGNRTVLCFNLFIFYISFANPSYTYIHTSIHLSNFLVYIIISGRCNTQVNVASPVQYGSFHVTCPTCGVRNKVDVPLPPPRFISPSDRSQIVAMNYNEQMPTTVTNTIRMPVKRALLIGINYIGNRAQLRGWY